MTTEEMHEYNKRQAINDLSYYSVCTTDFTIELRKFMTKWLDKAYEAGFKDSQRNGRCDIWVINNTITIWNKN